MGLLDKAVHGICKDIGDAVEGVAKGVGKMVEGGAELAAGALTLNPKEMAAGGKDLVTGGIKTASNAVELTPEGLESSAANNLLDGALEECGIDTGKDKPEGDDGVGVEDLMATKEFCEKLPGGMKPGFLKV